MTRLCRCMDDGIRTDLSNEVDYSLTIADIDLVMNESRKSGGEALLIPSGVALRTKEDGTLVVVDSMNLVAEFVGEVKADLRADET